MAHDTKVMIKTVTLADIVRPTNYQPSSPLV